MLPAELAHLLAPYCRITKNSGYLIDALPRL